ncbi:MAG: DUF427 domain-containing protein [Devosia sp.]|uniref:DUF427 domain-containing protein n=1 Tax=Devosia sp. TaxID=1871048 RepID=UPI0024C9CA3A|nr:DUF427 domain-containing protein [Devosia sp.]UYN99487.1 MAG: DUF427 domain-containing protein [Devosia sp.]
MTDRQDTKTAIVPVSGRVHIFFDDAEIASSTRAMRLNGSAAPQVFLPLEDVHPQILEASDTTREDAGPGTAHFYTVKTLTADGSDEAWYYPYAEGAYAPIRDMLTFGGDRIRVEVTEV